MSKELKDEWDKFIRFFTEAPGEKEERLEEEAYGEFIKKVEKRMHKISAANTVFFWRLPLIRLWHMIIDSTMPPSQIQF